MNLLFVFNIFLFLARYSYGNPSNKCTRFHKVRKNETLIDIAGNNKVPISKLKYLNKRINLDKISAGEKICVNGNVTYSQFFNEEVDDLLNVPKITTEQNNEYKIILESKLKENNRKEYLKINKFIRSSIDKIAKKYSMDEFYVHKCESQCEILKNNIINLDNDEKEIFSFTLINDVYEEISKSDTKVDVNTIYMPCLNFCYTMNYIDNHKSEILSFYNETSYSDNSKFVKRGFQCTKLNEMGYNQVGNMKIRVFHNNKSGLLTEINGCSGPVQKIFKPACNSHDVCYCCGSSKPKCDDKLFDDMATICEEKGGLDYAGCRLQASAAYYAVRYAGIGHYEDGHKFAKKNKESCVCTSDVKKYLMNKMFFINPEN